MTAAGCPDTDHWHVVSRQVQTACDRCTQGVMDADNSHLAGCCTCTCHAGREVADDKKGT